MNAVQLIAKKRDACPLSDDEIAWLVDAYAGDRVPDYQMAAFLMAVCLRGMSAEETAALTECLLHSGVVMSWEPNGVARVGKHSTGGVGDKVSLVLVPLLACSGVQVPKISGRGLGPTGGTLDKLEAIPGYRTDLTIAEFQQVCNAVGCVISGATAELVPAERKLYALRDVTATVSCVPLITASIMSKKLAEGLGALVLDVKHGSGAFMKTIEEARELARSMVAVGRRLGVPTTTLLTDMNQPLGRMAGNAVEVNEAVDVLDGGGPADVRELVLAVGAEMLVAAGEAPSQADAQRRLSQLLDSGRALEKFREMVAAQEGDLDTPRPIPPATEVAAPRSGVIQRIDTEAIGYAVIELGGGRKVKTDVIDHSVGIEMLARIGDDVEQGQPIARILAKPQAASAVRPTIERAVRIGEEPVPPPQLIVERIA